MHFYDQAEILTLDAFTAKTIMDYDAMQWWFLEHTYLYILLAIPASSILLYGIFRITGTKLNVAESAVVVLFVIAEGVFIQSVLYLCTGWTGNGSFNRSVESFNMVLLTSYAGMALYQLMPNVRFKVVRALFAFISGILLAGTWVASAYMLFLVMT